MAKRDKLTHRQKRQVAQKQRQRLQNEHKIPSMSELSDSKNGLIVSRYGEQADVIELQSKQKYRCYLRQNLGAPVAGDKVKFRLDPSNQGVVEAIYDRTSILNRPSPHQGLKPVVANINLVLVVTAPLPDFSASLLDRYLVALRDANIETVIIANKWDLEKEIVQQDIESQLKIYEALGYPVIKISTKKESELTPIADLIRDKHCILVGQSGVGKSSIINQLFPGQNSLVNEVSENSRLGQHTTTASQLFLFETSDGFIIDSPGIREFGLWHMEPNTIANGFIEFEPYIGSCKFRDCKHVNEPGCNIIAAVKKGAITQQRWQNYCKIISAPEH
ncbi:small ribosomal subunit biogenesis GTPase RsgA [Aliikangiella coralliicola]|uniref:small ribosomal subunit biogenesis GTPase RsgA n=1 Tax=Aliikangiella coralliicola TaxID=2592383 RepID=UPI00143CDC0C|nr:small ribosomal subunit biogenesis GTPase RsgA [Aliikangiella coralliicola]